MNLSEIQRRYKLNMGGSGLSVVKILIEAQVFHRGWETDNDVWLVELSNGSRAVLGTNHGSLCRLDEEELDDFIAATQDSLNSLIAVKEGK